MCKSKFFKYKQITEKSIEDAQSWFANLENVLNEKKIKLHNIF